MRARPQPNRRRGLLRAAAAVVGLTILLLIVIFVVSALTAPTVKAPVAPTPPATPGKLSTPGTVTTRGTVTPPATRPPSTTPGATGTAPKPTAAPTHKTKKDVAAGSGYSPDAEQEPSAALRLAAVRAAVPRAVFTGTGNAYRGRVLEVRASGRPAVTVGRADPYVTPVFSASFTRLLYVTVVAVPDGTGARWSLWQYSLSTHRSVRLAAIQGLQLSPLGWFHGHPRFTVARTEVTSLYEVSGGRVHEVTALVPEPVSLPHMSPDGRYIAFVTPADCSFCTLAVFDSVSLQTWYGPTAIPNERDIAWSPDSRTLVTVIGSRVAAVNVETHTLRQYTLPARLPRVWWSPLVARLQGMALDLVAAGTSTAYRSTEIVGG